MDDIREKLLNYVDENIEDFYLFLKKVVAFDSTNYMETGDEAQCQKFIFNEYQKMNAEVEIYDTKEYPQIYEHSDFSKGRDSDNRPNVTVIIHCENENRKDAKSIMLSSHTDTMPVGDIKEWKTEPFDLTIKNGKAYGLGIGDNKVGSAISYAVFRAIKDLGLKLKNNLYLTMVSDEEYFGGNGSLLACLKYPCDLYINMDGCDCEPQIAGLGGTCYQLDVKCGFDTSTTEPIIDALYHARLSLEDFGKDRFNELEENPLYTGSEHSKSAYRIMEFGSGTFGSNVDIGTMKIVVYTTLQKDELFSELNNVYSTKIKPYFIKNNIISDGFKQIVRCMEYAETQDKTHAERVAEYLRELGGEDVSLKGACLSDLDIYLRNGSEDSFNIGLIREFKLEGGAHKPNEFIYCDEFKRIIKALLLFVVEYCEVYEK